MKKYISILFAFSISALVFMNSCDKVSPPYKESEFNGNDTVKVRNFLLEEFTGHYCPNCPPAAVIAEQLQTLYGSRLILLTIHASDLALPGTGDFSFDLRSATGNDIYNFFGMPAEPSGMVSRTGWTSTQNLAVLDKDAWGTKISSLLSLAPLVSLEITNTYDTATRVVSSAIECIALKNLTGTYKIAAYLYEDSLVGGQFSNDVINYPPNGNIPNYIFRHVLRGALNSTWGDTLTSGNTFLGTQFPLNYQMTLSAAWNYKHCFVVAFVYDASNYEIMQVEEKRVK